MILMIMDNFSPRLQRFFYTRLKPISAKMPPVVVDLSSKLRAARGEMRPFELQVAQNELHSPK
jgi:hypothetical protein